MQKTKQCPMKLVFIYLLFNLFSVIFVTVENVVCFCGICNFCLCWMLCRVKTWNPRVVCNFFFRYSFSYCKYRDLFFFFNCFDYEKCIIIIIFFLLLRFFFHIQKNSTHTFMNHKIYCIQHAHSYNTIIIILRFLLLQLAFSLLLFLLLLLIYLIFNLSININLYVYFYLI